MRPAHQHHGLTNRSKLDNGTEPQPPALSETERADTEAFLSAVLQIFPLIGLRAFEIPKPIATPTITPAPSV
jgi:hypothetical protein